MVHRVLPRNLTDFQHYVDMAFKVLLVLLAIAMLLTSGTERSKEVSARGRRLCVCSDRVLRLSSQDSEAPSASCEEMCTFNSNAGVLSDISRRHLRSLEDEDVRSMAKRCGFSKLLPDCQIENTSVVFHRSGNSSEWFAEVSWSPYNGSSLPWIGYYILYFTGENDDHNVECQVVPKNQTSVNISSTKDAERINLRVVALPESFNSSIHYEQLMLEPFFSDKPKYLGVMTPPRYMEPKEDKITVIAYVSIAIGIVVGIALGAGLLKYCWRPKKPFTYFPPEFEYHAFVSFQKEDSDWVDRELLPFLEKEHHIQCCVHYRDFNPGTPFLDCMAEGVYKSYKIIAVFSSNFVQSSYCIYELELAQYRLLNKRDNSLIIIRIDKTDPSTLPPALQKRNFIDYSDVLERPFWKDRLLKFLNPGSQNGKFDRLNSTTSTATEISIVSLNEEKMTDL